MPKIEYTCQKCAHSFQILVFRGDEAEPVFCPKCGSREVASAKSPTGLFDGIASFSSLSKDRN
ncbi:MAG: zinc ribbon domain-containing protein [Desulfococcaceae bacterium]